MMKTIRPEQLDDNAFKMIGKDWMLVSACTKEIIPDGDIKTGRVNTMTASWGGVGVLWNKPVATIYLRPTRYTKEIIDQTDTFSLSVLPDKYKNATDEEWHENFYEPLRSGRVPGECLDFQIIVPLSEKEQKKELVVFFKCMLIKEKKLIAYTLVKSLLLLD